MTHPGSRAARAAAERALLRVVHHYGARPAFVLLGGLVPDLLCAGSGFTHSGTTDVDVKLAHVPSSLRGSALCHTGGDHGNGRISVGRRGGR